MKRSELSNENKKFTKSDPVDKMTRIIPQKVSSSDFPAHHISQKTIGSAGAAGKPAAAKGVAGVKVTLVAAWYYAPAADVSHENEAQLSLLHSSGGTRRAKHSYNLLYVHAHVNSPLRVH